MSTDSVLWKMTENNWWQGVSHSSLNLLTYGEYVEEWNRGKVSELGEYEKILLVACRHAVGTSAFAT
jgi:hypothetical protein